MCLMSTRQGKSNSSAWWNWIWDRAIQFLRKALLATASWVPYLALLSLEEVTSPIQHIYLFLPALRRPIIVPLCPKYFPPFPFPIPAYLKDQIFSSSLMFSYYFLSSWFTSLTKYSTSIQRYLPFLLASAPQDENFPFAQLPSPFLF